MYVRCDRPLVHEVDRLRRIIKKERIGYGVFDSIGYGTQGPPESAEAAMDYCRALRQLQIGGYPPAHITKSGDSNDQRPFGSVFWHNSARCTWNVKLASSSADGRTLSLGYFNRKNNMGRQHSPVGIGARFEGDRVYFSRIDLATVDELSASFR